MTLAETLRKAARTRLSRTGSDGMEYFSCLAVQEVSGSIDEYMDARDFLHRLGCSVSNETEFDEFLPGPIRQGARFLWLDFAALVAEDWGL